MLSQLQPSASPLTGAYYWVPRPDGNGVFWDLVTCHDLDTWAGISHREFWPLILEVLAERWGKNVQDLIHQLHDHHAGLPRGRVTHPQSGYVVINGDDTGLPGWLELVKSRFGLDGVEVTPDFTEHEHEQMLTDDLLAVQASLGVPLYSNTTI